MTDAQLIEDEPSLIRTEPLGALAGAARLALQECETADSVQFAMVASPEGLRIDCLLLANGHQIAGWGQ